MKKLLSLILLCLVVVKTHAFVIVNATGHNIVLCIKNRRNEILFKETALLKGERKNVGLLGIRKMANYPYHLRMWFKEQYEPGSEQNSSEILWTPTRQERNEEIRIENKNRRMRKMDKQPSERLNQLVLRYRTERHNPAQILGFSYMFLSSVTPLVNDERPIYVKSPRPGVKEQK